MSNHELPRDWFEKPLGNLAEARRGITYSASMLEAKEGGLPYVNMKSFIKGGGFNHGGTKTFVGCHTSGDLVGERDLLIANTDVTAGDIVGVPALLPEHLTLSQVLFSHHVTRLRLNDEVTVPFLYYLLCLPEYRSQMLRIARGTTVLMLDMHAIKRVSIRAPKLETAQRRITEILTTLDEVIEATEKLVEKHKQIKAGLMHDLFTRGLWTRPELARGDHKGLPCEATAQEGQLRPTPEEAPGLYQDSPLGLIPRAWGTRVLPSVASYQHGRPFPSSDYAEAGVILLRPGNLDPGGVVCYDDRHTTRIPPKWLRECPDLIVSLDDIVMNLTAQSLDDQFLGRVCIVRDSESAMLNQRIARFTPKGVEHHYLYWLLRSIQFRSQIDRTSQGTKVQHIYNSDLNRVQFAVPSDPDEQRSISGILFSANEQIESDQTHLAKLRQQKQGLMHDLLTGRVRVSEESAGRGGR